MKNFNDVVELLCLSKDELLELANQNKVLNLNELKKIINNYDDNKRADRLEFSEVVDYWIQKGLGREIGYADVHQFIIK